MNLDNGTWESPDTSSGVLLRCGFLMKEGIRKQCFHTDVPSSVLQAFQVIPLESQPWLMEPFTGEKTEA